MWTTVKLAVICIGLSVLIGIVGAWLQGSRLRVLKALVQGYIQFFRNTPPLVQMYFFYFALGPQMPRVVNEYGIAQPMLGSFEWAVLSLSFFAGAFNVEIFRSGIEAVQKSTVEAADSLGFNRLQIYRYVVLPLALALLPAGAQQQSRQSRQDDDAGLCDRRARDAVRGQPDLVRPHQRARDDGDAADVLSAAGRHLRVAHDARRALRCACRGSADEAIGPCKRVAAPLGRAGRERLHGVAFTPRALAIVLAHLRACSWQRGVAQIRTSGTARASSRR